MKRIVTYLLICALSFSVSANSVEIGGVKYSIAKHGTVKCKAGMLLKKGAPGSMAVKIESQVRINNSLYIVSEIEDYGFKGCKSLLSIEIPQTVTNIGCGAFWDCKSLQSVVIPDNATAEIPVGSYGFGKKGIFSGCVSLIDIKGTSAQYPRVILENALYNCDEVPFISRLYTLSKSDATTQDVADMKFSEYAKDKIQAQVEVWQKKKEYETTAQWRERVTEDTRKLKVEELVDKERKEFIDKFSPSVLVGNIGTYDADYNIFPIEIYGLNTIYVSVPIEDAPDFKNNWYKVKANPVYGIVDDKLGVLSCTFSLNDKTYQSADTYENDNTQDLALNLSPLELDFTVSSSNNVVAQTAKPAVKIDNSIDLNIPSFSANNKRTFAVIIGNENYQRTSMVQFANNDAVIFGKYCNKTLGIPFNNIKHYKNATFGNMLDAIRNIKDIAAAFDGNINVIFYYAGHGVPSNDGKNSYLLPVDADGTQLEVCYPIKKLYEELGSLNAQSVVVFLDACFSGAKRGDGMLLASRATIIKPHEEEVKGNVVVFSASSGEQTAFPYEEKGHGMFTYFLLEKLRNNKGDVTLGDLSDYINENVRQQSVIINGKLQTPTLRVSSNMKNDWSKLKLK